MNIFVIILLSFSLVNGFDYKRRCLFFKNSCVNNCPRNMHPYHTRCDKDTISQRTCRSPYTFVIGKTPIPNSSYCWAKPTPKQNTNIKLLPYSMDLSGYTCGWSRCDCDNNLVLSEVTWQCMELEKCLVVKKRKRSRRRGSSSRLRTQLPKRIVIEEGDLIDVGNPDLEPGPLDNDVIAKHGKVASRMS